MKVPIKIWRFKDAPKFYRVLSQHGGDEDWVALIPKHYAGDYIGFLEVGGPFGYYKVETHKMSDGTELLIGAHA